MAKSSPSDSDPEEVETPENSSSEENDDDDDNDNDGDCKEEKQQGISEYEKQRLSRIAQNKARMEALGLSKIASSFMGSAQNSTLRKGKRKVVQDDEDYTPIDDHDNDDDDEEDFDDDDEFLGNESPRKKKRVNKKSSKPKKKIPVQKQFSSADYIDCDDDDLMQAIALSLQESAEVSGGVSKRKGKGRAQEDTGKQRRKKLFTSRVQMTEDEVVLHFFQLDEAGTGSISIRDLQRVAIAHDFTWTDKELADMIHCFDSDGDGKISLDDFRKIVVRLNMVQGSEIS